MNLRGSKYFTGLLSLALMWSLLTACGVAKEGGGGTVPESVNVRVLYVQQTNKCIYSADVPTKEAIRITVAGPSGEGMAISVDQQSISINTNPDGHCPELLSYEYEEGSQLHGLVCNPSKSESKSKSESESEYQYFKCKEGF